MRKRHWNSTIIMYMSITFAYVCFLFCMQAVIQRYQYIRGLVLQNMLLCNYQDYNREYAIVRSFSVGQALYLTSVLPSSLQMSPIAPPANLSSAQYNKTLAARLNAGQADLMRAAVDVLKLQDDSYVRSLTLIKSYRSFEFDSKPYVQQLGSRSAEQKLSTLDLPYLIINRAQNFIDTVTGTCFVDTVQDVRDMFLRFLGRNLFGGLLADIETNRLLTQSLHRAEAQSLSWTNIGMLSVAMFVLNTLCTWVFFEYYPIFKKCTNCIHIFGLLLTNDIQATLQKTVKYSCQKIFKRSTTSIDCRTLRDSELTDRYNLEATSTENEDLNSAERIEQELRARIGCKNRAYLSNPTLNSHIMEVNSNAKLYNQLASKRPRQAAPKFHMLPSSMLRTSPDVMLVPTKAPDTLLEVHKELKFRQTHGKKMTEAKRLLNTQQIPEQESQSPESWRRGRLQKSYTTRGFFAVLTEKAVLAFCIVAPVLTLCLYWDGVAVPRLDGLRVLQSNALEHLKYVAQIEAAAQSLGLIADQLQVIGVIPRQTALQVLNDAMEAVVRLDNQVIDIYATDEIPSELRHTVEFYRDLQDSSVCTNRSFEALASSGVNVTSLQSSCKEVGSEFGITRTLRELFNFVKLEINLYNSIMTRVQGGGLSDQQQEQLKLGLFASAYRLSGQLRINTRLLGNIYFTFGAHLLHHSAVFFDDLFWYNLGIGVLMGVGVAITWIICCGFYYSGLQSELWAHRQLLTLLPETLLCRSPKSQDEIANI